MLRTLFPNMLIQTESIKVRVSNILEELKIVFKT